MDAATGLLYVGNGQYYDPATGRFLTRNAKPNQSNPYTPFDPLGALFAPLGLVALTQPVISIAAYYFPIPTH